MRKNIRTFEMNFRALGPEHFIWLPLTAVPIIEQYPVNSLEQPALSIFNLAQWNAIGKFAIDNQVYLSEIASQFDEMGYFLIHCEDKFGIIGVDEYHYGRKPGRATIFNAHELSIWDNAESVEPTMLRVIYTSLEYPWRKVEFRKGDIAYWSSIHIDHDYDDLGYD